MNLFQILLVFLLLVSAVTAQELRYEAEDGQHFGTRFADDAAGYSGTGYVTGFDAPPPGGDDYFQLHVDVPEGLYSLWVGYRSEYGDKGYYFQVDGEMGSGMFDESDVFTEDWAGVFYVASGTNTLAIHQFWGYYDVDYLEFRPFTPPAVLPVAAQLSDPLADARTHQLMNYLTSIYGSKTLAGQQHDSSKDLPFPTQAYLNKSAGLVPAVRGSDFIEYSPSRLQYGANPDHETEQSIEWAHETGGVVTMTWHWNAPADLVNTPCGSNCGSDDWPWWRGFYTEGTNFNLPGALANPQGSDYQLLLRDIDAIAVELQKFEDAGVPVIWRPLHEAQGGWFWWGAHGADSFKELWHLMYDRLTNVHGLHNLIWEFTSSAAEGNHLDWYPGDDVVDIVGLDIYTDPSSSMSGQWNDILEHYDGRKLIALSETGTLPDPDVMDQWNISWSYFSPWTNFWEDFSTADLQAALGHEDIITLDELPAFSWYALAPARFGDYNGDQVVDAADYVAWRMALGTDTLAADGNGDGFVTMDDYTVWRENFGRSLSNVGSSSRSSNRLSIPEPGSWLLATIGCALLAVKRVPCSRHSSGVSMFLGHAYPASP